MSSDANVAPDSTTSIEPLCPVYHECGGCAYQHVSYSEELKQKLQHLSDLLQEIPAFNQNIVEPVVPSPREYHYRHRLDLRLLKTREQKIFVGFSPRDRFGVVEIDECPIAMKAVSDFIPQLKQEAAAIIPKKYRLANLVVRCGDNGEVHWGGIGKGSLRMEESDYFWTEYAGRKIYFALETFFQANLSILPKLFERIERLPIWSEKPTFYDLYGGVGLFSIALMDLYQEACLIENCRTSVELARYNKNRLGTDKITVIDGRVEDHLDELILSRSGPSVAMIDPPRSGLSSEALEFFVQHKVFSQLLYLSCNPEALVRDLQGFLNNGWTINQVIPFDFFPKTRHLETLVWLTPDATREK